MRNITVFLVLVIMLNCIHVAAAQDQTAPSYAFSTWTRFGMLYGQAEEIVYPSNTRAELLSQLLWDIKPIFYYGLSLDFSRTQPMAQWGFFTTLSLKNAIPGKSGEMEDRDWMSVENSGLTHYSTHDAFANNLFLLDLSAGLSFPIKRLLLLKPYVAMSYMHFDFSGKYGHGTYAQHLGGGKYASINDTPQKVSFSDWEKVINYTQDWLSVGPGISIAYYFFNIFCAELFFQISPWVLCNDLDEHLTTGYQFRDYMRGGLYIEPGFHFSWFAGKRLELSLDFSWRHINGTRGETWWGTPIGTANPLQQGEAGAGLSMIDAGLCLKIRL